MSEGLLKVLDQGQSRFESSLASMGMATPARRFIVGTAAGALLVWALRPSSSYDEQGQAKSWTIVSSDPDATSLPWWGLAMIPGVIFSTFF